MTVAKSYPDSKFDWEFSKDLPPVGEIVDCNVLTAKPRDASLSFDQWRVGIPAHNRKITQQLRKAAWTELALNCWDKALEEAEKGWAATPHPVTEDIIRTGSLPQRFAIREHHGNAKKQKIRLLGDFKRSGANSP